MTRCSERQRLRLRVPDTPRIAAAHADIESAIALDPQNPYGYILRGFWRQRQNRLAEAMADFDRAISLRSDLADYYVRRGGLLNQIGDLDRAMSDLDRAIALNPGNAEAFYF